MNPESRNVIVIDVKMPFTSMVVFIVKWAIAAIPALVILGVLWWVTVGFIAGLVGGRPPRIF